MSKRIYSTPRRRSPTNQTPYLNHERRHQTKAEMVKWAIARIASWNRPAHHLIIKMGSNTEPLMNMRIERWRKAVKQLARGSFWYKTDDADLLNGIMFFEETGGYLHAHVVAVAPIGGTLKTLLDPKAAKHLFGHVEPTVKPSTDFRGNPALLAETPSNGSIWGREIANTDADRRETVSYVLKSLEAIRDDEIPERQCTVLGRGGQD